MDITYIGHSGFMIEWETSYWLFDYYRGEIPSFDSKKKIYVFASHKHGDHFNPEIFKLLNQYSNIEFVLSSDIKIKEADYQKLGITKDNISKIISVKPSQEYELQEDNDKIILKTLKSTDCGVAFLLAYQGKTIYHAGDLNLWVWKLETKQYNNNMTSNFNQEMKLLEGITIDIAFVPLDPRQEDWYSLGMDQLLNTAYVRYLFPMHFWDKPDVIRQYKQERGSQIKNTTIMDVCQDGQKWEVQI